MKIRVLALLLLITAPAACRYRLPDLPGKDVPPGPIVTAIEARRELFRTAKAVARVETERGTRRRAYESVAIIVQGRDRLRVEGFGPLGESLYVLLWDGAAVRLRTHGQENYLTVGQAGLERALGMQLEPADLCAALVGALAPLPGRSVVAAGKCLSERRCMLDLASGSETWRLYLSDATRGILDATEIYGGGSLLLRGRFDSPQIVSGFSFPMRVTLERPDRALRLMVEYQEVEVNVPVDEALFLEGRENGR